jgi:hypothetical protein
MGRRSERPSPGRGGRRGSAVPEPTLRTRNQMDGFLKVHGVDLPLTMAQVSRDSDTALAFSE